MLKGHRHELAVQVVDKVALIGPLEAEDEVVKDFLAAVLDCGQVLSLLVVKQILDELLCGNVSLL